jgi:hypothetical protein
LRIDLKIPAGIRKVLAQPPVASAGVAFHAFDAEVREPTALNTWLACGVITW